jgi:hypothetical protein
MENISVLDLSDFPLDEKVRLKFRWNTRSKNKAKTNPVNDIFISEGDDKFLDYLNWHGLADGPDLLMLSSNGHYYYDFEDLRGVKTLVNQKKLNHIKELNDFLYNVHNLLSPRTHFIGCFSDYKTQKRNSLYSRMYRKIINFLDSKIETEIDNKELSRLLESHGFKVIDMTEIDGLTYFLTQN